MSHSLESYLITHWARLELAAMSMRDQATSEVVHELRVSYKKVRAVSRVTGVRLALEPIKPLYTACGAVREHEIFEGILSVIDRDTTLGTDPLHRSLQARRRSAGRTLHKVRSQTPDALLSSVRIALLAPFQTLSPNELRTAVRTRLQRKERRLCSHVADLHDVGVLHAVRKDLKDISYLARFAEPQGRDRKRSLEERVADAESFLGVVHDQQQLAAYIRCYPADRLDITTRRFLLGRLQRRIDDAIVEITPRIRDLCERW